MELVHLQLFGWWNTSYDENPSWPTQALLKDLAYGYDMAGNRTSAQEASVVSSGTANAVNQVLQTSGGGMMRFAGTVSKPSTVTVGGNMALVRADNSFEGYAAVSSDSTTRVHIVATDTTPNRNTTDKYVDVPPSAVPAKAYAYDLNGNMTAAGPEGTPDVTYGWDAANRLTSIVKSGTTTVFDYDGLGRRVREWTNGAETKRWVWDGLELCEERDSNNAVTKRYYAQGMQVVSGSNSGSYYYTRDHLGSVREMTSGTEVTIRARYDYAPYGQRSANLVTGTNALDADFGFTGHYQHAASGLTLAPYRAYDANLGRWISRDPLRERGGMNLYGYVGNNPINAFDPLGLYGFMDFMQDASNFTAGVGDAMTGGLTAQARAAMNNASGSPDVVDPCSKAYGAGGVAGKSLLAVDAGAAAVVGGAALAAAAPALAEAATAAGAVATQFASDVGTVTLGAAYGAYLNAPAITAAATSFANGYVPSPPSFTEATIAQTLAYGAGLYFGP